MLIVEDDVNIRLALAENLVDEGYGVTACPDGKSALAALSEMDHALVLLDIMLPDIDGYSLCERIRSDHPDIRIILLTARTLEDDIVRGFDAGANDYVTKPYRLRELFARVGAQLRDRDSGYEAAPDTGFTVDRAARRVTCGDDFIELTKTEFDLLVFLVDHAGEALPRATILSRVWGENVVVEPRTVDNFMSSLKRKVLDRPESRCSVVTVRGVGYRFEVAD